MNLETGRRADTTLSHPFEILHMEDDLGDVLLTRKALRSSDVDIHINVASDGVQALAYLRAEGAHTDAVRPDLILLDLNMPRKDGRELLAELKQDLGLRSIPVIVLTTSDSQQDVLQAYDLQAACYIKKPIDLEHFTQVACAIHDFWLTRVRFPEH